VNNVVQTKFYHEEDGDLAVLDKKTIGIIGYGNYGRPLALNILDSKIGSITVGSIQGEPWQRAQEDGFCVFPIAEACVKSDVVLILLPDDVIPDVYDTQIAPYIRKGSAIVLASGYNLAYKLIKPKKNLDILLLAPRMIGEAIRQKYIQSQGFPSFISVEQDASGQALPTLLALTKAIGSLKTGAMVLTAKQEAYLDLYFEQGLGALMGAGILASFQVGVEAGFPPEALVLEMYKSGEMAQTFQAMANVGFFQQVNLHGFTSAFGGMIRSMTLDRESIEQNLRQVLSEIKDGSFVVQLQAEKEDGYPSLSFIEEMLVNDNPITAAEKKLNDEMHFEVDN
jgi:ketol-acid reductoisomerase